MEWHWVLGYHQHLRLELAASLLRDGDLGVAQVAARMGFETAFHFSRAFRRWYGQPPSLLLPDRDQPSTDPTVPSVTVRGS
ncbi:MAG: helix-turn-helix transcriptional regulator [Planctomycetota bacterium]